MRFFAYITLMVVLAVVLATCGSSLRAAELAPATTSLTPSVGDFLPVDEAFQFQAGMDEDVLTLYWSVTPGHYLYRHTFEVMAGGVSLELVGLPRGEPTHDEYFGDVEVFYESVAIAIPRRELAGLETIEVRFQGCAEAGFCYPPQKKRLNVAKM